jgi:anaerobic magnesium-protoporphyrin IX monomethyl ester cyclase
MRATFITDDFIIDPLGIGYLSSYLKAGGHEVDLLKTNDPEFSQVLKDAPDMLCYSVTTGNHRRYADLNALTRKYLNGRCVSVFGGPHVTFFPEFCQQHYIDFGVRGEGFDALVNLADAIETHLDPVRIPNVVSGRRVNMLRPLKNKATLLMPDRQLIYKYASNYTNRIKNVMCSFGCPADCPYCYSEKYKEMYCQQTAEIRPVDGVIEEIRNLMDYPLELIFFQDDIFPIYKREWLDEFVFQYRRIGIPFHIQVRAEFIKRGAIKQLKEVGLHGVTFAIESGNSDLRYNVLNRRMKDDVIIGAAWALQEFGVNLRTENMVGIPGETWETAMETVRLNAECNPAIAWASLFQPYPGTELGDKCLADGTFDGELDDISESFFDTYRLKVKNAKKYERLQKLFSFFVKHKRFRVFAKLLCSLPFKYKRFYGWYKKRLYGELYSLRGS